MTEAVAARRNALAGHLRRAVRAARPSPPSARAARTAALSTTRANRQRLESRIAALEAARAREARVERAGRPVGDPVADRAVRVGRPEPAAQPRRRVGLLPDPPSTWKLYGGSGPAAWKASKAEQDRVAARIWAGGSGASQWVCAALVG